MPRQLFVAGNPRSGTSALTRLLQASGLDVGDDLLPPAEANAVGFFEDRSFVDLQREMIATAVPPGGPSGPRWMRAGEADPRLLAPFQERARALVARRDEEAGTRPWGFKDPRTTMFLDFWTQVAPIARFVFAYRPPWGVLDSLSRLSARPYAGRSAAILEAWIAYNEALLRFADARPDRCAIVHVDAVARAPHAVVACADALLGGAGLLRPPATSTFVGSLLRRIPPDDLRAELVTAGWPRTAALYAELEARAELPAATGASDGAAVRDRGRGSGEVAIDVVGVGTPVEPEEGAHAVEVEVAGSSAEAVASALGAVTADDVAFVFDGRLRPGALRAAAAAFAEHRSVDAVLLLEGGDGEPAAGVVDPVALVRASMHVPAIAVSRTALERCGGLDPKATGAGMDAWAVAVAVMASGGGLRQVDAAVTGSRGPHAADERNAIRRHVVARHGELAASTLLPATDVLQSELLQRTTEIGELHGRVAEVAGQRDELAERWTACSDRLMEATARLGVLEPTADDGRPPTDA